MLAGRFFPRLRQVPGNTFFVVNNRRKYTTLIDSLPPVLRQANWGKLLDAILNHPLNLGLKTGNLSLDIFKFFLEQDKLYLLDFSKALYHTAERLHLPHHREILYEESKEALETQINLHDKYLKPHLPPTLFIPDQPELAEKKIAEVLHYTEFLITNSQQGSVEEAVASLIPCFLAYSILGLHMQSTIQESNRYKLWIASYAHPKFIAATKSVIRVLNELLIESEPVKIAAVVKAFNRAIAFEIALWDRVYAMLGKMSNHEFRRWEERSDEAIHCP